MKAKDIMTGRVISIGQDASVFEAARLMLQNHISGLPVVDSDGALVGIVTEGDFLRRAETGTEKHRSRWIEFILGPGRAAADFTHSHGRKVEEVMSANPLSVSEDTSVEEIVNLMERHRIKRVPVMRGGRLAGIVSRANLLRAMLPLARIAEPVTAQSDVEIRARIKTELANQKWAPVALVDVMVNQGIVDLWGTILDERDRKALKVLAENVAGVKAVNDHTDWVEPMSGFVLEADEPKQAPAITRSVA
jgi:CBS domain-containing protein